MDCLLHLDLFLATLCCYPYISSIDCTASMTESDKTPQVNVEPVSQAVPAASEQGSAPSETAEGEKNKGATVTTPARANSPSGSESKTEEENGKDVKGEETKGEETKGKEAISNGEEAKDEEAVAIGSKEAKYEEADPGNSGEAAAIGEPTKNANVGEASALGDGAGTPPVKNQNEEGEKGDDEGDEKNDRVETPAVDEQKDEGGKGNDEGDQESDQEGDEGDERGDEEGDEKGNEDGGEEVPDAEEVVVPETNATEGAESIAENGGDGGAVAS